MEVEEAVLSSEIIEESPILEETPESEEVPITEASVEIETEDSSVPVSNKSSAKSAQPKRLVRFPLSRTKTIMKADPECHLIAADAVLLTTKATELFLAHLSRESSKFALRMKRKTLQRRDVDSAISTCGNLFFLDGAIE